MNPSFQCLQHQLSQRRYKFCRIVQPGTHLEASNPQPPRFLASLVIDLAQRLHVVGNKGYRNDADLAHFFCRQITQRPVKGRLQPLAGAHFALVAEAMMIRPSAASHQQAHGFFNVSLIRIALGDD